MTLKIGMMWFDNDAKKSVDKKIQEAVKYYLDKYGTLPDECEVSMDVEKGKYEVEGIRITRSKYMLPNIFLIGKGG